MQGNVPGNFFTSANTMDSDDDTDNAQRLFPGIPEDKRVGILRTFHHKMYDEETYDSTINLKKRNRFQQCCFYYCNKNVFYGLCMSISLALVLAGILAILYGYMIPPMYEVLDQTQSQIVQQKHKIKAKEQKDLFIICGIVIISLGLIAITISAFVPLYRDVAKRIREQSEIVKTPIIVDYEIAPYAFMPSYYEMSSCDSMSDYTPSPCNSPIAQHATFQQFYIQNDPGVP